MTFQFIDSRGMDWMVIPGLPADYPIADEDPHAAMLIGFTFRAGTGELRVLPRAEIGRSTARSPNVAPWRIGPRFHQVTTADWEALLDQARPWP